MPIDTSRPFFPVRIAVLTVSDTRTAADDRSGDTLVERLDLAGHQLAARAICKDEVPLLVAQFNTWIDDPQIDCIISTGGTGVTGRDVTPEALAQVQEKAIPGFRRAVPLAQLPDDRHLDHPVPRLCRRGARHLYLRPARIDRRG